MKNRTFFGSEKKERIEIVGEGFSMVDDDFDIILRRGKVEKTFNKSDLIHNVTLVGETEQHEFYLCFDTTDFGPGSLTCIVKAYVPDSDFPDGIRTEIDKFELTPIEDL